MSDERQFAAQEGFLVQLARYLRRLTTGHIGFGVDRHTGRQKRYYRSVPRKQMIALGKLLNGALGAASVALVDAMSGSKRRREELRQNAISAIREAA
jgi:hypothetical protein